MKYQVVEKFVSINGEGTKAGQLAVFIRLKGCNLHCSYCDTTWANQEDTPYEEMTEKEIHAYIRESGVKNVTLTGGEPLLAEGISDLLQDLASDYGLEVEIETNGSVSLRDFFGMENTPSFTMDYKLGESGQTAHMCTDNFALLTHRDTVKFVVGSHADLEEALEVIRKYRLIGRCGIYFSPVFGKIEPVEIVDFMLAHKLNDVNLQLQLHKFIWEPEKKGV